VSNLTIFFQDLGGVLAVHDHHAIFTLHRALTEIYAWALTVNGVTWSLGVELTFYACAPWLIKRSNRQLILLVLVGLALKICAIVWLAGDLPYRMTPFVFANFILGMLAYRKRGALIDALGKFTPWVAYCLMLLLTVGLPNGLTDWEYSLLAVALTTLIVPALFHSSKRSRLDNRLGEMSYPFYLFHIAVITVLHSVLSRRLGVSNGYVISLCNVIATVIFSQLVLALEDRYVEPYRQRLGRPSAREEQRRAAMFA
jgi:peptidoglycan/LPS O-acetylase OafA/YrhL